MRHVTSTAHEDGVAKRQEGVKGTQATRRHRSRAGRCAALVLAAASLAIPTGAAAYAQPGGFGGASSHAQTASAPPESSDPGGFSWGDAGIGAGTVAGLVALTGTGLAIRRRGHVSTRPAA
jgi:hypothetical protein